MLERQTINKIITDNLKLEDNPNRESLQVQENIKEEAKNDKSFDQLLSLQLCIQKHSGLKELCKFLKF